MDEKIENRIEQQVAWARRHDWFIGVDETAIYCLDRQYSADTGHLSESVVFFIMPNSFSALRAWAGY